MNSLTNQNLNKMADAYVDNEIASRQADASAQTEIQEKKREILRILNHKAGGEAQRYIIEAFERFLDRQYLQ